MPGWTTTHPSRAAFLDYMNPVYRHPTGIQIDWAAISTDYADAVTGKKVLPAGTAIGLLAGSGKGRIRVDATNPAVGLLETPAVEDDLAAPGDGMYGLIRGGTVWENFLPEAAGSPLEISADVKAELVAGGGPWIFVQYVDTP